MIRRIATVLAAVVLSACTTKSDATVRVAVDSAPWRRPGDAIDSILPMAEYLRRFRVGVDSPAALTSGYTTREALVRGYLAALSRSDTATLSRLLVTRAEFAWLLFPDHRYAAAPYELDPAIFWRQVTQSNAKGMARALARHRGMSLALLELQCTRDTLQLVRGRTALWGPCQVTYRAGDSTFTRQLFGSIVDRDGGVKFLSYANDF
ncbi:MAG: hypothetical protein V4558_15200 [Gemmatimonadota bacterium]